MIKEMDWQHNGYITFQDFEAYFLKHRARLLRRQPHT